MQEFAKFRSPSDARREWQKQFGLDAQTPCLGTFKKVWKKFREKGTVENQVKKH